MKQFPEVLYVNIENGGADDGYLSASKDVVDLAEMGETVTVAVYRLEKLARLSTKTELVGEQSAPSSEAPATAKRGKKAKQEPVIAPGTVDGPAEVRQDAKATKEQAQTALEKVFSDKGLQTARDLLSRYGVQRLQDMKSEQYGAFVEHAGRVLTGGEV